MPIPLPSSRLAWYALGRFWKANDAGDEVFDAGYFAHIELEDGEIFVPNQPIGPASAHFTFFSEPFTIQRVQSGPLAISRDTAGGFYLFYQRSPQGDFTEPTSFAQGKASPVRRGSEGSVRRLAVSGMSGMARKLRSKLDG